jgi:hypothetical protein
VTASVEEYFIAHTDYSNKAIHHAVGNNFFRNYGRDITALYSNNATPGCTEGDYMHRRLLKYADDLLNAYSAKDVDTPVFLDLQVGVITLGYVDHYMLSVYSAIKHSLFLFFFSYLPLPLLFILSLSCLTS